MRFTLQDRTYQREPQRYATLAAAGIGLLEIAVAKWFVKRCPDMPRLMTDYERRKLAAWGLYVAKHGGGIERVGHAYASRREVALRQLLEDATRKTWPGTPAASLHVVETTPAQRRVAKLYHWR